MADYTSNLKTWGATGTAHPDGYNYLEGEQPVDDWDNWLIDQFIKDVKGHLVPLTNSRVESDYGAAGGEPGAPDGSHLYHDQDNERLELYDGAASSWRGLMFSDGDTLTGVLDLGGNDLEDGSTTIWDTSGGYIPQGRLQNASLTVAGNSVALGGSTGIALGDLSNVTASGEGSGGGLDADLLDGNHASDLGVTVADDGTVVNDPSTGIDFATNLSVTDDGDGTVTVNASGKTDSEIQGQVRRNF